MTDTQFAAADKAIKNYKVAWSDVIVAIALTVINLFTLFLGTYFLFSIYASTLFFTLGVVIKKPELAGGVELEIDPEYANILFGVYLFIGLAILALFVIMFIFARKHNWAMITLLVLFSIDTLVLLIDFIFSLDYTMLIDLAIHGVLLFYIAKGVQGGILLKKLFPEKGAAMTRKDLIELYEKERAAENPAAAQPMNPSESIKAPSDDVFPELGKAVEETTDGERSAVGEDIAAEGVLKAVVSGAEIAQENEAAAEQATAETQTAQDDDNAETAQSTVGAQTDNAPINEDDPAQN